MRWQGASLAYYMGKIFLPIKEYTRIREDTSSLENEGRVCNDCHGYKFLLCLKMLRSTGQHDFTEALRCNPSRPLLLLQDLLERGQQSQNQAAPCPGCMGILQSLYTHGWGMQDHDTGLHYSSQPQRTIFLESSLSQPCLHPLMHWGIQFDPYPKASNTKPNTFHPGGERRSACRTFKKQHQTDLVS
jgi:hypothetical protein